MKNIVICILGHFNYPLNFSKIENWKSNYFKVVRTDSVPNINVNHFEDNYLYPNQNIINDMGSDEDGINLKVAIVDQPLEGNYYMHRLEGKKAVISLFPVIKTLKENNVPLENFLLRCIYEMVVFLYEGSGVVNDAVYEIPHHETRGCIFDMNVFLESVCYSCNKPTICDECKTRLNNKSLPKDFLKNIEKELKKIKLALFYRIENRIKRHPIIALIITAVFAVILNIIANYIYEILKNINH